MEENITVWHQAKLLKYDDEIRSEAQRNGWTFHSIIIEVGARGWIPHGVNSALTRLGLPSVKELCHDLSHIALKSSYVIWLNRWNKDFQPWRLERCSQLSHSQSCRRTAADSFKDMGLLK